MKDQETLNDARTGCGRLLFEDLVSFTLGEMPDAAGEEERIQAHLDECEPCRRQTEEMFGAAEAIWAKNTEPTDWDRFARSLRDRLSLELLREEGGTMSETKPVVEVGSPQNDKASELLYAQKQLGEQPAEKELVGEWIVKNVKLPEGGAGHFDAGSSNLEVFRAFLKHRGELFIDLTTNSLLILQEWISNPDARSLFGKLRMSTVGSEMDTPHLALYGGGIEDRLLSWDYRPACVFIGTNGFGMEDGRLLFAFHAPAELGVKSALFLCPSRIKIILTTARKIGNVSGRVLDLFTIPVYEKGDWYLATTAPKMEERESYDRTLRAMREDGVTRLLKKGINFHWIEIKRAPDGSIIACDRMEEDPTLGLIEAEARGRGRA
jgi:DeoR/GlpR family transcriptional regulator of sugar metabolism